MTPEPHPKISAANCYNKCMHQIISFAALYLVFIMVLLPTFIWFRLDRRSKRQFIIIAIAAAILAFLIAMFAKHFILSPRPFISDHVSALFSSSHDNGFPSDHTLLASLLAFVTLVYNRPVGLFAVGLAGIVGWARVLGGVHHAKDIFGAFLISGASVLFTVYVIRKFSRHEQPVKPAS